MAQMHEEYDTANWHELAEIFLGQIVPLVNPTEQLSGLLQTWIKQGVGEGYTEIGPRFDDDGAWQGQEWQIK